MDKYEIKTHTIPYQFNVEDWLLFAITVAASALLYYIWLTTYGVVGLIVVTGMCISAIGIEVKVCTFEPGITLKGKRITR